MRTEPTVRIWAEDVLIPTYLVGEPNRNPMFLEKRVYQGSSGRVYPYPVIDRICDEPVEEKHPVVFLENEYLKLMVMPRFGGRIQYAYDKTNGYAFIYHNRVIKPALVGLAGPWLSGGIEFNWPQHHRPGTYCPVNHAICHNQDGSMTLWLSEIEPMWHLKGTLGLTLFPGRAYLQINIRLFNPTSLPLSFHLWTNPAVHVNDHYQSVFPPDVQAVYDHGKRDVSSFPIARGKYYKVDYSKGVDISWYKNLPVPTSYMAAGSNYDFIGGYDHRRGAGVLHVADHHVVPGKKQWVWGCGDFGRAWDRNLTDADGPYAELMCGVFADNQPDFSWLQPYEEKEVREYFLPYKAIGYVRNATMDAAVSLETGAGKASLGAYTTESSQRARIRLTFRKKTLWEGIRDLAPDRPFTGEVELPKGAQPEDLELSVWNSHGQKLVGYRPEPTREESIPEPAKAIPEPGRLAKNEDLYLAGLHLEQYRHATREPEDYYREALRRDPGDIRNNSALGLLLMRRGQCSQAEPFFRAAIQRQTRHNPNPLEGEPHYNLGVCLRYLERPLEARDSFYKAAWNAALQGAAFFQLAQIDAARGQVQSALEFVERALACNRHNQKATHLKITLLRRAGKPGEAIEVAQVAVARDPLDFAALHELALLRPRGPGRGIAREKASVGTGRSPNLHESLEIAADYAHAGFYKEAILLLEKSERRSRSDSRAPGDLGKAGMPNARPMVFYFMGRYSLLKGDRAAAANYFKLAARQDPDRCFPNSLDAILALRAALDFKPQDAHASLYLGNLWYDKRQVNDATACWEAARRARPSLPTVHRNLALVYFNNQRNPAKALRSMQKAFALAPSDSRVLFELDLLKKRAGVSPQDRFRFLNAHRHSVEQREDLLLEFATLLNFLGRHREALNALLSRKFHPWEGGEGKVTGQYVTSLVEVAKRLLGPNPQASERSAAVAKPSRGGAGPRSGGSSKQAIELLERAQSYPENLGEGKLHGAQENQIHFWLGVALSQAGDGSAARAAWRRASTGLKVPTPAVYYNDQNPETIFYQGLALQKLGKASAARQRFETLIRFGEKHLKDHVELDYFAVSLPEFLVFDDDLDRRNQINCQYLMGLGHWALGRRARAKRQFRKVLELDPSHMGAELALRMGAPA